MSKGNKISHIFYKMVYWLRWKFSGKKPLYVTMWNPRVAHLFNRNNNIGDDVNIPLLEAITNRFVYPVQYATSSSTRKCYSVIGSLIPWWMNRNTEVWGSGVRDDSWKCFFKPTKVYAVRGPLTREYYLKNGVECPAVYGDPALLLPLLYMPAKSCYEKKYDFGIICHESETANIKLRTEGESRVKFVFIDILNYKNWQDVINQMCQCRCILSSSLHGLILSDAYRIPSVWCKFMYDFGTGYVKFHDYFKTVGRDDEQINEIDGWEKCLSIKIPEVKSKIDILPLIEACPFENNLREKYESYIKQHQGEDVVYE